MTTSALLFIGAVILIGIISILLVFKTPATAIAFFKTPDGKAVFKGIVIFTAFGTILALLFGRAEAAEPDEGAWFAYGEVFLGVDYSKELSPQCHKDGPDDHATSNGGLRVNIYQSADERFELNSKYTHHSCAFSSDREVYDAIGIEVTYRLW